MNLLDASAIAHMAFNNQKMEAIRLLRNESSMGLTQAHAYLQTESEGGERSLYNKLCADFVQNPHDLLVQARAERKRLDVYIEQLESEISDKKIPEIHNVFSDRKED